MNRRVRPRQKDETKPATPRPGITERLASWRDLHLYSAFSSLGRLSQRPWASLLTVGVMAIALALPLGLLLTLGNVGRLAGDLESSRQLGLFLERKVDADAAAALAQQIEARDDVAAVSIRTPDEGLAEFREMTDFAGALLVLDGNPLPTVLNVEPAETIDPQRLAVELEQLPETDFIQYDAAWRERLLAWLDFGRRFAQVIALLLGLGALLVVGNTVRLDIHSRADEISIVQLLGATNGFVRRPFLYLGLWYGLAAGVLALLLVEVCIWAISGPLASLTESYGSQFRADSLGFGGSLAVLCCSALLGWLGAWLAAGHHLRAAGD
ncbi:MAG: permease-like cell division protein FtsX [Xanthomonadales bacterium]|nr:permease-like cell division protein FtsX [Xanthomonadales bacterium]